MSHTGTEEFHLEEINLTMSISRTLLALSPVSLDLVQANQRYVEIAEQTKSMTCTFKPYTDECKYREWLWDCSKLNLEAVPQNIPEIFRDKNFAMDLSRNSFTSISSETFSGIDENFLKNVTALYLQFNNLRIVKKSAFEYLGNLCVLDLSNCKLGNSSLAYQSFANLTKLKILRMHHNEFKHLGYPDIAISRILSLESLTIGVFEGFHFCDPFEKLTQLTSLNLVTENSKFRLTNTTFAGLSRSPIHYLSLQFQPKGFCDVSEEIFCSFPVLKGVHIQFGGMCDLNVVLLSLKCLQNRTMDYIVAIGNIPIYPVREVFLNKRNCKYLFSICVKKVKLSSNRIAGISENPLKTRMGQCIEYFDISHNRIGYIKPVISFDFLNRYPNLQLSNNFFHIPPSFSIDITVTGERLKEINVSNTNLPCKHIAPIHTSSLEILDISNNGCGEMKLGVLQFATKLEKISASNAELNFSNTFKIEKLFIGLKRLKDADLSHNSISHLPNTVFQDQKLSLSTLNLDKNELSNIPVSHLQKLLHLQIRFNKISVLAKSDIENLSTFHKDLKILIEGNPISCECAHISSLKWMRGNQHIFGDLKSTQCIDRLVSMAELFQEKAFIEFEKKCQVNIWLSCSSFLLVLLLLSILTAALLRKYRVHIDYVILRLRGRWKGVIHVVNAKTFRFDAFVSYAEEDYQLACTTLYRELVHLGFQISLPDKDFIPGISKAEQLLQYIDDSRKVIILVTENFLMSGWDSYAIQMVVTHAFHNHRQKSIIVIIKDGIPIERIPKDLRYIWWSIISIRWPENGGNMISFWEELSTSLNLD
ncbi:toll-like receptor 2 [Saccostrea echinata]|uniref:toll-like receptor 2 n=1 Tax=Saccostrea echinata TaxID=191078 RepID=UPI002A816883|nr:toll-like receptor 2 [Saccostrea echinata]